LSQTSSARRVEISTGVPFIGLALPPIASRGRKVGRGVNEPVSRPRLDEVPRFYVTPILGEQRRRVIRTLRVLSARPDGRKEAPRGSPPALPFAQLRPARGGPSGRWRRTSRPRRPPTRLLRMCLHPAVSGGGTTRSSEGQGRPWSHNPKPAGSPRSGTRQIHPAPWLSSSW
jgi:hypothetical protein